MNHGPGHGQHAFLRRRFSEFLKCGQKERGSFVLQCQICKDLQYVPMRCKQRGLCLRCTEGANKLTRRSAATNLVPAAYRHWVVNYPHAVSMKLAFQPQLAVRAERAAYGCIFRFLRDRQPGTAGGMIVRHRAGSDLTLLFHNHLIITDGTFGPCEGSSEWAFATASEISREELHQLAKAIWEKLHRFLKKHGLTSESDDAMFSGDQPLSGMMARYRGLHLFASNRIEADDQSELDKTIKYIFRPLIDSKRLRITPDWLIEYKLTKPDTSGKTHMTLSVNKFMELVGSLLTRQNSPISRYIGIFASGAANRKRIIQSANKSTPAPAQKTDDSEPAEWTRHLASTGDSRPTCINPKCFPWHSMRCIAVCNSRSELRRFMQSRTVLPDSPGS